MENSQIHRKIMKQRNDLLRSNGSSGKIDYIGMTKQKRLAYNMRKCIRNYIFENIKSKKTEEILGTNKVEYKKYLQSKFKEGMTWENYGKVWQIDHIIPSSSFKFNTKEDLKKCFNYKNTQPLFRSENLSKFDKNGENVYLYSKDISSEFRKQKFTEDQIYFLAKYLPLLYTIEEFKIILKKIRDEN